MINDFIKDTITLIKHCNFELLFPEILDIELKENGAKNTTIRFMDSLRTPYPIKNNFLLVSNLLFSLIDAYIDTIYTNIEGKTLKKRYDMLNATNDIEIIIKETYRILKTIRNATVHCKSKINMINNSYQINYTYGKTNFYLEITKEAFEKLITIVIIIINAQKNNMLQEYIVSILRTYYEFIINNTKITDDSSTSLMNTKNALSLQTFRRYRVLNTNFKVEKDYIEIEKVEIQILESNYANVDYVIEYNNIQYLIPGEKLTNQTILISELGNWEYVDFNLIK